MVAVGKKQYRIGLNPACPVHHVTLGGQVFAKYSERVTGHGIDTKRDRIDGHIVELSPAELKRCLDAARTRIIRRTVGKRPTAHVTLKDKTSERYETDLELAPFVYAEIVESSPFAPKRYQTLAETLGEEGDPEPDLGQNAPKAPRVSDLELRERELELRERELAYLRERQAHEERELALAEKRAKLEGAALDAAPSEAKAEADAPSEPKAEASDAKAKIEAASKKRRG